MCFFQKKENEKRKFIGKKSSKQDYTKIKNECNEIDKGKDYKIKNAEADDDENNDILLHDSDVYCLEENEKEIYNSDGEDSKEYNNKSTKVRFF